jgi:hypothetical protein
MIEGRRGGFGAQSIPCEHIIGSSELARNGQAILTQDAYMAIVSIAYSNEQSGVSQSPTPQ